MVARRAALRALVGVHNPMNVHSYWHETEDRWCEGGQVCEECANSDCEEGWTGQWPCLSLRHVAAIWAWHPDYRPEWAADA